MRRLGLGLLIALGAARAEAADKLQFGPPAAWVKPAESPPAKAAETAPAVRYLLEDRQVRFGPEGASEYLEQVTRIQSPLGLQMMGSVGVAWSPKTDTVTIHKLHVLRGGQTIDVLAHQSFSVIQREEGLPEGMIDGALTATLQPEGLQTGDVVDFAYTIVERDPATKGHWDMRLDPGAFATLDRLRLRAVWDAGRPVAWRASDSLGKPRVSQGRQGTEIVLEGRDLQPLHAPTGAPARFRPRRELQLSDFKSWAEVSALVAPYFQSAATLKPDSRLKAEVARIRALSDDPKVRAGAALKLVEDKVRRRDGACSHSDRLGRPVAPARKRPGSSR